MSQRAHEKTPGSIGRQPDMPPRLLRGFFVARAAV
jgi:hypothetical protein